MDGEAPRHTFLGLANVITAGLLLFAVWEALPARWWPIDIGVTGIAVLFLLAGVGLLGGASWAQRAGIVAGWAGLLAGLVMVTLLALTASELVGLYGPVGRGAAIILSIVFVLLVPYLVFLPAAQLVTLLKKRED